MKALMLAALVAAPAAAAAPQAPPPGQQTWVEVCQSCHMANGKGGVGAGRIASLAGDQNLAYPEYPIAIVTGGKGPMPWFRGELTDQQIADVISYARTHFGNGYRARVSVAEVAKYGVPAPKKEER